MSKVTIDKVYISGTNIFLPPSVIFNPTVICKLSIINTSGNVPKFTVTVEHSDASIATIQTDVSVNLETSLIEVAILHSSFTEGLNTIHIVINDSFVEGETTLSTEWTYPVKSITRDTLAVERSLTAEGDFLLGGSAKITYNEGLVVQSDGSLVRGLAIMKDPVNMNGHAKVDSINVTTTADESQEINFTLSPISRENIGEFICETYSLEDLKKYSQITGFSIIEE